jgi:DNA-binding winged helix-turn-helix (wHTH) protein
MNTRMQPDDPQPVRIEAENEWAWCGARRLTLTPRAFAVLRHLVEHRGRLVTKQELLTTIWRDTIVSDAALASGIRDLRKALGDSSGAPRYIQTVHRRGFRFIGPVTWPTTVAPVARAAAPVGVSHLKSPASLPSTPPVDAIVAARKAGAAEGALQPAQALHRKAQWRLDFVAAENSMGFHAPQELAWILGESIDFARQGQLAADRSARKR